jgi:hypothetical protein
LIIRYKQVAYFSSHGLNAFAIGCHRLRSLSNWAPSSVVYLGHARRSARSVTSRLVQSGSSNGGTTTAPSQRVASRPLVVPRSTKSAMIWRTQPLIAISLVELDVLGRGATRVRGRVSSSQLYRSRESGYSELGVWVPACACSAESRTVSSRAWTRTCAPEPTPKVQ